MPLKSGTPEEGAEDLELMVSAMPSSSKDETAVDTMPRPIARYKFRISQLREQLEETMGDPNPMMVSQINDVFSQLSVEHDKLCGAIRNFLLEPEESDEKKRVSYESKMEVACKAQALLKVRVDEYLQNIAAPLGGRMPSVSSKGGTSRRSGSLVSSRSRRLKEAKLAEERLEQVIHEATMKLQEAELEGDRIAQAAKSEAERIAQAAKLEAERIVQTAKTEAERTARAATSELAKRRLEIELSVSPRATTALFEAVWQR